MRNMRNALFALMLALIVVIATPGVVHATTITKTTPVRTATGTYTEYVRKADGVTELGQMTLSKTVSGTKVTHITKFTTTLKCNSVTVYASYKSGDWVTNTSSPLRSRYTIRCSKTYTYSSASAASVSKTYGKCSVSYPDE